MSSYLIMRRSSLFVFWLIVAHVASSLFAGEGMLLVEAWQHRMFGVYPVEKIRADDEVAVTPLVEAVRLSAARGESESFILLLRSQVPLRDVEVKAGELKGAGGSVIPASALTARRLGYVFVDEPSGTRMKQAMPYPVGTGLYPDPLLPGKGDARPGRNLQFFITIAVPREAKPGLYEGALRLGFRRESWMPEKVAAEDTIRLALYVRSFAMPERSPLLNTSYANLRELPVAQRTPDALGVFQSAFVAHRQMPEPLVPSPKLKLDAQGRLSVDSSAWEAAVEKRFALGGTHVFVPVWGFYPEPSLAQGIYFLHHYPAVVNQRWLTAKICQPDKTLTPEFRELFGDYLRHVHRVLKKHGWLDRAFIATMDEPYTYHAGDRANDTPVNNYEVIRNFVTFIRDVAPGLRTFCTADPADGLTGFIDHWCLRNLDHAAAAKERAEKHGEVITFCDNYRTFIDYPAVSARSLGWLAWQIGARGWLTFETLGSYQRAWEGPVFVYPQFNGATVWGMGQMFYPDPLTGAPLPSLRWELMREGCDDYEYLWLLREKLRAHPSPEAQQFLDTIARDAVHTGGDAETTRSLQTDHSASQHDLHERRERIAAWLEKLGVS